MIYDAERGDIRMVAMGDTMLTCRLAPYKEPDYLRLVELVRSADVSFANLETTVRNREEGYPAAGITGTVMSTPPELLDDLKWMGINLVSTANNHACDYGIGGVLSTMEHLKRAQIPYAGSGATLGQARGAGYLETRAGRVALLAATSATSSRDFAGSAPESAAFAALARAGDPRPDCLGRPGVNPIRFSKTFTVDAEGIAALNRLKEGLGFSKKQQRDAVHFYTAAEAAADKSMGTSFLGGNFKSGTKFGISTKVNQNDAEANLRYIRDARRRADWVIFSFHNHECTEAGADTARTKADLEESGDFMVEFSRAAIDAGADVVAGHGPHVPLGVEIYKGRPILYSLGNFVFQSDLVDAYPSDVYGRFGLNSESTAADFIDARSKNDTSGFGPAAGFWHGLLAECEFRSRKLSKLHLHPLDMGFGLPRSQRGRPLLARGEVARETLERIQRLSLRYGTKISIEGETGVISLD